MKMGIKLIFFFLLVLFLVVVNVVLMNSKIYIVYMEKNIFYEDIMVKGVWYSEFM